MRVSVMLAFLMAVAVGSLLSSQEEKRKPITVKMGLEGQVTRSKTTVTARPGDTLPYLRLPSTDGRSVELSEETKSSHLILFFYPGDLEGIRYPELAGCTPEGCAFRDNVGKIRQLGGTVFGVNLHSTARQRSFVERELLSFELLSDSEKKLTEALGIPIWRTKAGEEFVDRVTIIVAKGGKITHVFEDVQVEGHIDEILEVLEKM